MQRESASRATDGRFCCACLRGQRLTPLSLLFVEVIISHNLSDVKLNAHF